jgi:hypothetical protein
MQDFDSAEAMYRATDATYISLGLLTNRGLAYEGMYKWREALSNYDEAVYQSSELGYSIPYILNSRGNCHASLAALVRSCALCIAHESLDNLLTTCVQCLASTLLSLDDLKPL